MAIPVYQGGGIRATAREFFQDSLGFVLRRQRELGDLYRIRLPFRRLFISTDPALFQEVLVNRQRQLRKSPAYREMGIALARGLLTSEGDFWLRQRRLMQPAFHRSALEKLYAVMRSETEAWLDDLAARVRRDPVVDLSQEMMRLTSDIALRTLFSTGALRDSREVAAEILRTQAYVLWRVERPWMQPFFPLLPGYWRFRRDIRRFNRTVYDLIRRRRESGELQQDLLDLLLHARDADSGEGMNDRQLRDEIITLYVAGHDTSANTLAWACQLLMDHPGTGEALAEEARTGYAGATPDATTWPTLGLARLITDETLRLYPPAHAIGREVVQPFDWKGETFTRGDILLLSIYGLHRHPGLWAEPDRFLPERFSALASEGRHKYAFLPFGAGPRLCIGAQFALQEIPLILSALFRRFRLEPLPGEAPRPTGLLTLKPLPAVRARLQERPSS